MKLTSRILIRILLPLLLLFTAWTAVFYYAMIAEVNDETDDALELYAEDIIRRHLDGRELPSTDNGTNNNYFIERVEATDQPDHYIEYSDETVWIAIKNEYEPARVLRTTFNSADGTYLLTVMTPTIEKDDLRKSILVGAVTLYIAMMLMIALVVGLVLYNNMKPLYRLLGWLDENKAGNGLTPLDNPTKIDEFALLNEAVLRYERRNEEVFERQKEFIGNASHEIQTPLAICSSRLEMLADTPLTEEQLGEIVKTQQTLEYISRLNRSLLLLAKIDSGQFQSAEKIDINALVRSRLDDFGEIYSTHRISVEVTEQGIFEVVMDKSLAMAAVTNLLKNAFIHNIDDGRIEILLTHNSLTVRNSGQSTPLDNERVFTRFYQSQKREGSTGLGLAVVDSVARFYGLAAAYDFERGMHCFSLTQKR